MPPKHAKALHHHAKAGDALKAGDVQMAMHHTGHVLSALRHGERSAALGGGMSGDAAPTMTALPAAVAARAPGLAPTIDEAVAAKPSPFGGMRGRLAQMKK